MTITRLKDLISGGRADGRRGVTLMELIIALSISLFIFELIFYVYMMAYRSWDIGLVQGRVEDEARRAVQSVSREVRAARSGSVTVGGSGATLSYLKNDTGHIFYMYVPASSFQFYQYGSYSPTQTVQLKLLASPNVTQGNYGTGTVIAKDLLPPPVTMFRASGAGISFSVGACVREYTLTLNTQVYPRSIL